MRTMRETAGPFGRGVVAFIGRFLLGLVSCGVLGLAFGLAYTLLQDPNCERDCDVLAILCTVGGLLVGVIVGLVVAIEDRRRGSRVGLRALIWMMAAGLVTVLVALLLGVADQPPVS